jgi:hypothetical protein
MDNRQQSFPTETRRRKLDDLFGDDPYLSPTMKARRLHEKLETPEAVSLEEIARESVVADPGPRAVISPEVLPVPAPPVARDPGSHLQMVCYEESGAPESSPAGSAIPFADAAAFLRVGRNAGANRPAQAEQLHHLREQVLLQWLKSVPPREAEQRKRSHILGKLP